jgi:hypothetical protein
MIATKNSGRILGALFAVSIALGVTGTFNRGLSGLTFDTEEVIMSIIERIDQMKFAMLMDIFGSAVSISMSIYLFKFFRSINKTAAMAYIGIALVSFALVVISNGVHWQMISSAASGTYTLASLSSQYDQYYVFHFIILLIYSFANFILFYFMWQTNWIPRWLTIWGTAASILVTYGSISNLLDISPPFVVFVQNGLFMVLFTGWLLIAGFNSHRDSSAIAD